MSSLRTLLAASAALCFVSCAGTGRVDVVNPTTAELDRLDTQWGLQPRKSRGAPKRTYQYSAPTPSYSAPAPAAAPAMIPPRETVDSLPPAAAPAPVDPATINRLR